MTQKDLLDPQIFQRLWNKREENEKFCVFLKYLGIDLEQTILISNSKYIILYNQKEEEYLILLSNKHHLEEDFIKIKDELNIRKQRIIFLKD